MIAIALAIAAIGSYLVFGPLHPYHPERVVVQERQGH